MNEVFVPVTQALGLILAGMVVYMYTEKPSVHRATQVVLRAVMGAIAICQFLNRDVMWPLALALALGLYSYIKLLTLGARARTIENRA